MAEPMAKKILRKFERYQTVQNTVYFLLKILGAVLSPVYRLKIKEYRESHSVPKLQIGCGRNLLEGWLNTDLKFGAGIIFLDAGRKLPFETATFDYIFSEHMLEHFEYSKGVNLLKECFRILKPGGKLRIATPNLEFLIQLYNPEKSELQKRYISWAVERFLPDIGIYEDTFVINNFFQSWGHRFIYDPKTLQQAMKQAGFAEVLLSEVGKSQDPVFKNLESHGGRIGEEFNQLETMVVEGIKPF